jgi:hypothetical protein
MQLRRMAAAVLSFALTAAPAAAQVQMTIKDGRVSLSAKTATPGQILAEWAKVGQTKIVNAERVTGSPLTLELTNVPEVDALDILLRSASGYLLAPRPVPVADASQYDRILILPMSSAPSPVAARAPATPPVFAAPRAFPQVPNFPPSTQGDDDQLERPNAPPNAPVQVVRPPVFNTFPQPQPQQAPPPPAPAPTSSVTAPAGVAVPGMVVPTPQPSGQNGANDTPDPR